jgi:hypothetical protein
VTWDSWGQLVGQLFSGGWLIVLITCLAVITLNRNTLGRTRSRTPTMLSATRMVDLVVLMGWLLTPLALLTGYSLLIGPLLLDRYLLFSGVAAACLLGVGVAAAFRSSLAVDSAGVRMLGVGLLTIGLIAGGIHNVGLGALRPATKNEDLRAAAEWIRDRQLVDDGIVFTPTWSELGMRWYLSEAGSTGGGRVSPTDLLADPTQSAAAAGSLWSPTRPDPTDSGGQFDQATTRIFVVGYPGDPTWEPVPDVGSGPARAIQRCWTLNDQDNFGISVQLWVRPQSTASTAECLD